MHELPLVFFTVLAQSAVGAFILLRLVSGPGLMAPRRLAVGLFSTLCLFGVAMLIATFHLGQPFRAINVLLRMGHSPMSDEIALAAVFAASGGAAALGLLVDRGYSRLCHLLSWVATLAGIALLFAIPRVYQLSTVATWDTFYTPVLMLLTAFSGGGLLAAVLGARKVGVSIGMVAIVASFCLRPGYLTTLHVADSPLAAAQLFWFNAQMVLFAMSLCGLVVYLRGLLNPRYLLAACALVTVCGELAGRVAFYNLWALPM